MMPELRPEATDLLDRVKSFITIISIVNSI